MCTFLHYEILCACNDSLNATGSGAANESICDAIQIVVYDGTCAPLYVTHTAHVHWNQVYIVYETAKGTVIEYKK